MRLSRPWGLYAEGLLSAVFTSKADAVETAAGLLRQAWRYLYVRSELVIKARDGRIIDTRTYGEDPRRTKG